MAYGTNAVIDTLASSQQTIAQYGEDNAFQQINAGLEIHNRILQGSMVGLVERTTDRQRRYGGASSTVMAKKDEYGRSDAQKITAGSNVGFPLELFDYTVQWTRKFMQNATVAELAAQFTAAADAHRTRVQNEMLRALMSPTNFTHTDYLVDHVDLPVKRLVNADSAPIPLGPNGESFTASSHTHYLARVSTLAASDITGAINTVIEHHAMGRPMLYINRANEAALRAFTGAGEFLAYQPVTIQPGADTMQAMGGTLPGAPLDNRPIGIWGTSNTEVWVKPWIPANYMFTFVMGAPAPLVYRTREAGGGGLVVAAEDEHYPLRARTLESEFGFGVWTRTNGAVLYVGGTTYTAPTIAA
jgi:hypothetical protein